MKLLQQVDQLETYRDDTLPGEVPVHCLHDVLQIWAEPRLANERLSVKPSCFDELREAFGQRLNLAEHHELLVVNFFIRIDLNHYLLLGRDLNAFVDLTKPSLSYLLV